MFDKQAMKQIRDASSSRSPNIQPTYAETVRQLPVGFYFSKLLRHWSDPLS